MARKIDGSESLNNDRVKTYNEQLEEVVATGECMQIIGDKRKKCYSFKDRRRNKKEKTCGGAGGQP